MWTIFEQYTWQRVTVPSDGNYTSFKRFPAGLCLWHRFSRIIFSSPDPKDQVSYCYHWASVVRLSLAFCILMNSSKTIGPIWGKLWWNVPWVVSFQNCVRQSPRQPRWLLLLKIENSAKNHLTIFLSELAGPIGPKLRWNGLQIVLFEKMCPTTAAANQDSVVTNNRKFGRK